MHFHIKHLCLSSKIVFKITKRLRAKAFWSVIYLSIFILFVVFFDVYCHIRFLISSFITVVDRIVFVLQGFTPCTRFQKNIRIAIFDIAFSDITCYESLHVHVEAITAVDLV